MTKKRRQILERPTGEGKIYRDDNEIATARYSLVIMQEIIIVTTHGSTEELPGLKDISGQITVREGEWNLMPSNLLTLHLSDGRRFEFIPIKGDPVSGTYNIVPTGRGLISTD